MKAPYKSPQFLFGLTLVAALLCFGIVFDRLADAIEASQPAEVQLWLNPQIDLGQENWIPF